jgi:tyrosyl-tRNA synthetase
MEEVEEYGKIRGAEIRKAKEILAFEATKIIHGENEAEKARDASKSVFGRGEFKLPKLQMNGEGRQEIDSAEDAIPTTLIDMEKISEGIPAFKLFETTSLCASGSEARRLIEQGGAYINSEKVKKFDELIKPKDFDQNGTVLLRAGKKKFHRIKILDNN